MCRNTINLYKKQNLRTTMHPNQQMENNRFFQQAQSNSHQKQFVQQTKSIEHPTKIEISNIQDIAYQYYNFIKENGQISTPEQHNDKKQETFWSENGLELANELKIHADSCVLHNQCKVAAAQNICCNKSSDLNQQPESKMKTENISSNIGKAVSQPHLLYDNQTINTYNSLTKINYENRNSVTEFTNDTDKCEIFIEGVKNEKYHRNSFTGEHLDFSKSESSLEICSSVKRISLDKKLELQKTKNALSEKFKVICKTTSADNFKDLCMKQNNEINCGQQEQNSFFGNHLSELTKKVEQTDIINNKALNNPSENIKYSDKVKQNADQLTILLQGSGSDYDKTEQCSSVIDSGRGSAIYLSDKKCVAEEFDCLKGQDAQWIDIVESELSNILRPNNIPVINHSNFSDSLSSVTPPLPPVTPPQNLRTTRNRFATSLDHADKSYYNYCIRNLETCNYQNVFKKRDVTEYKKQVINNFTERIEAGDLTSTTTGLDLDSMLDRSDSDLSINNARTIKKQLDGLEHMYTEVLKLLGNSSKQRRKKGGLASYGSVSSLPTSSVSSRPLARHHDKKRSHLIDDRMKKTKDLKNINKRFQRLESHVVTLARSVAHLSSEMRTQHLMIQEMENIRSEISTLRTQINMAMIRSQSQPVIKESDLPALSNPSRVKKLTKFFGVEPPLIRLFLRELGYEKYANLFEKEKIGMVELPYLSEERLQEIGVPLGPRLRILQEARISVCKNTVYII